MEHRTFYYMDIRIQRGKSAIVYHPVSPTFVSGDFNCSMYLMKKQKNPFGIRKGLSAKMEKKKSEFVINGTLPLSFRMKVESILNIRILLLELPSYE